MKRKFLLMGLVLAGCGVMAWVEAILRPAYPIKSVLKWALFLGCITIWMALARNGTPCQFLRRPTRNALLPAIGLSAAAFFLILGGYALLSFRLDLSAITGNLGAKEGITARTFPLAALYISFGNSFLEELFFRGFAFLTLRETGGRGLAYGFSALIFALYHICIMDGWFSGPLFFLLTAALAPAGLLFNFLDRDGTLWPAWLVHMAANLAINTIGLHLFGLI